MENCFIDKFNGIIFEDSAINNVIDDIFNVISQTNKNDFSLICSLHKLRELYYPEAITDSSISYLKYRIVRYKLDSIKDFTKTITLYELCEKYFHFNRKTIEKLLLIDLRFIDWSDVAPKWRIDLFNNMTLSKIRELLPLSIEQINFAIYKDIISIKSTVKELRAYVKEIKGGEKEENKVLEESISEAEKEIEDLEFYNPDNHYEIDFFESCTKEQLIAIISRLQFEYEKLKKKK